MDINQVIKGVLKETLSGGVKLDKLKELANYISKYIDQSFSDEIFNRLNIIFHNMFLNDKLLTSAYKYDSKINLTTYTETESTKFQTKLKSFVEKPLDGACLLIPDFIEYFDGGISDHVLKRIQDKISKYFSSRSEFDIIAKVSQDIYNQIPQTETMQMNPGDDNLHMMIYISVIQVLISFV